MSVEEVGVRRVDIARLHRYHIGHKLRCWRHGRLEEIDDHAVEALTQRRIPTERLLETDPQSLRRRSMHNNRSGTHDLCKQLAENTDEFVIDKLAAFKPRLLEPLDLLLHNDFKRSCPNEESRC